MKKSGVKSRTSKAKTRNHLRNKGRVNTRKNTRKCDARKPKHRGKRIGIVPEEEVDMTDMLAKDELHELANQYNKIRQIRDKVKSRSKRVKMKGGNEEEEFEKQYETSTSTRGGERDKKMLLPIKTKSGIERRYAEDVKMESEKVEEVKMEGMESSNTEIKAESEGDTLINDIDDEPPDVKAVPVSMVSLFAERENAVQQCKFRIGLLCTSLLENPEGKIENLNHLLDIMKRKEPEFQLTIKKLCALSLVEVFNDLIPGYQIKHPGQWIDQQKLKKVTRQLVGYESELLKGYKEFLTRLEKVADTYLRRKRGDHRAAVPHQYKSLGLVAIRCFCTLLTNHPYFNLSDNIVQYLTVYLDNPMLEARKEVENCFKTVLKEDKKGLISLTIVRRINHLLKTRLHNVREEALSVLLSLRIKGVNLDEEKEQEISSKKLAAKKRRLLSASKRERKRKRQLEALENEMLEARAEESKAAKMKNMTEITKITFLIYFRILKTAPNSSLLSLTLEGLAKFAHCINLDFFQDLANSLDKLLRQENPALGIPERLYCISTIFVILSGQGDVLNIDPAHFYAHLYRNIPNISAGEHYKHVRLLLSTLETVLVNHRKKATTQRTLAFVKRLATASLHFLQDGTLGTLSLVKSSLQLTKGADNLLDVECSFGEGVYDAYIPEPDFCHAQNAALYELAALQRHFHPVVRKFSKYVAGGASASATNATFDFSKAECAQLCKEYDPSSVVFKPAIQAPIKMEVDKMKIKNESFVADFIKEDVLKDIELPKIFSIF